MNYKVCNTSYFCVQQVREIVIIMANKIGIQNLLPIETNNEDGFITTKQAIGFLSNAKLQNKKQIVNGRTIYNHIASTNVNGKFIWKKHQINQADICDYLKEWIKKQVYQQKK